LRDWRTPRRARGLNFPPGDQIPPKSASVFAVNGTTVPPCAFFFPHSALPSLLPTDRFSLLPVLRIPPSVSSSFFPPPPRMRFRFKLRYRLFDRFPKMGICPLYDQLVPERFFLLSLHPGLLRSEARLFRQAISEMLFFLFPFSGFSFSVKTGLSCPFPRSVAWFPPRVVMEGFSLFLSFPHRSLLRNNGAFYRAGPAFIPPISFRLRPSAVPFEMLVNIGKKPPSPDLFGGSFPGC